jgi:hypothetical protein
MSSDKTFEGSYLKVVRAVLKDDTRLLIYDCERKLRLGAADDNLLSGNFWVEAPERMLWIVKTDKNFALSPRGIDCTG